MKIFSREYWKLRKARKLEKKRARAKRRRQKKLIRSFHKSVDYLDIDYVAENYISIHKEEQALFGLKLIPPKIALESEEVKRNYLSHMCLVLNSCDLLLYHDTIRSPIDVSVDLMNINSSISHQKDEAIRRLWINEAELLKECSMNMQTEFFILHKCATNDRKAIQKFDELFRRFRSERFEVEELRRKDLLN